jgi:hypothetical protein
MVNLLLLSACLSFATDPPELATSGTVGFSDGATVIVVQEAAVARQPVSPLARPDSMSRLSALEAGSPS